MYQDLVRLTTKPGDMTDITSEVQRVVTDSGTPNGLCVVFSQGSTCSVFVNENDAMLLEDLRKLLKELVKERRVYHHPENAHSHLRAILLGSSTSVPVRDGMLQLGQWQAVFVAELDVRPRRREILVSVY